MRSLGVVVATKLRWAMPILAFASIALYGCNEVSRAGERATALRFGIFAADATGSERDVEARYRPVAAYLESSLARPVVLTASADAGRVLADFEAGRLDAVFNRAIAFPHAQEAVGAVPLVTRQEDRHVTTVFLARAGDHRQSLQDFRGARLVFSVRLGSSYVIGRHYLDEQHIAPETSFQEVHFSGVADEAVRRVLSGKADLGVANSQAIDRMLANGSLEQGQFKIVAETPPHVGQLWFVTKEMSVAERSRLRDAFMALSTTDPRQAAVLHVLGASSYVPVLADDYGELTELMRRMRLLDFEGSELP